MPAGPNVRERRRRCSQTPALTRAGEQWACAGVLGRGEGPPKALSQAESIHLTAAACP